MNRLKTIWIPVLTISLTFFSCGEGATDISEDDDLVVNTRKILSDSTGGLTIAYYAMDSISAGFNLYREIDSTLKAKEAEFERTLRSKYESYAKWEDNIRKRAESGEISGFRMQEIEQEAMQKQQEIAAYERQRGAEIQREVIDQTNALMNTISGAGREFCEENGIDMLFFYQKGGQITYISNSFDVTKQFIRYLNKREDQLLSGFEAEVENLDGE
jgi:Skp family chaperone for outer membrane proteins